MAPGRVGPALSGKSRWRPLPSRRRRESAHLGPTGRAAGGRRPEGRRGPLRPGHRRSSRRQRNGRAGGARAHPGRVPIGGRRGASAGTRRAQQGTGGVVCARVQPRQAARQVPRESWWAELERRGRASAGVATGTGQDSSSRPTVGQQFRGRATCGSTSGAGARAAGPGRGPGHRGWGSTGKQEAGPEDDAGLRDQSTEGHAEPGDFGGSGRAAKGRKRRPSELDCVRVCKQGLD